MYRHKSAYEKVRLAPAAELIERRQQAGCLDAILVRERERHKLKKLEFKDRWDAAAGKMKELDQSLERLNIHYIVSVYTFYYCVFVCMCGTNTCVPVRM